MKSKIDARLRDPASWPPIATRLVHTTYHFFIIMSFYHRTLKCQHKTVKNLHHLHQKWHLELSFYISFIFEKIKGTYKDAWFHLKLLIKTWWSPKHDLAFLVVAESDGPVAVPDGFGIDPLGHPVGPPGPTRRVVLEVAGLNRLSLAAVAPLIAPF